MLTSGCRTLIVECEAKFAGGDDRLTLELTKGNDKFQAVFAGGDCKLYRISAATPDKPIPMGEQPNKISSGSTRCASPTSIAV